MPHHCSDGEMAVLPLRGLPLHRTEPLIYQRFLNLIMAEREGFEPPDPCGSTVFKTAAFDRSATSPD